MERSIWRHAPCTWRHLMIVLHIIWTSPRKATSFNIRVLFCYATVFHNMSCLTIFVPVFIILWLVCVLNWCTSCLVIFHQILNIVRYWLQHVLSALVDVRERQHQLHVTGHTESYDMMWHWYPVDAVSNPIILFSIWFYFLIISPLVLQFAMFTDMTCIPSSLPFFNGSHGIDPRWNFWIVVVSSGVNVVGHEHIFFWCQVAKNIMTGFFCASFW